MSSCIVAPAPNRSAAAREFLTSHARDVYTAREVLAAVEPKGSVDVMGATLSNLVRRGEIIRHTTATGGACYGALPRDQALARLQRVAASKKTSTYREAQRREVSQARQVATPRAAAKPTHRAPRRRPADGPGPYHADPKRAASARIAADIAAFHAHGGRVELLPGLRMLDSPACTESNH